MIAVLDDEESVRKAIVRLLQAAGYPARAYASGHQLLQHWTVDRPECLLLDLQMRDQCGVEVLQALTLAEVHVPVLIITAQDSPALRTECMRLGAVGYLKKPVDKGVLLDALRLAALEVL